MGRHQWNLLLVGTLTPQKFPEQFFDALQHLRSAGQDVHGWEIDRRGWRAGGIIKRLRQEMAAGRASWMESVPDTELEARYRCADLVVHCSLYEGFGFVPGEACFTGARVLCRRLPSVVEYLGSAVEYFDTRSGVDLGEEIRSLLQNSSLPASYIRPDLNRSWLDVATDLLQIASK